MFSNNISKQVFEIGLLTSFESRIKQISLDNSLRNRIQALLII